MNSLDTASYDDSQTDCSSYESKRTRTLTEDDNHLRQATVTLPGTSDDDICGALYTFFWCSTPLVYQERDSVEQGRDNDATDSRQGHDHKRIESSDSESTAKEPRRHHGKAMNTLGQPDTKISLAESFSLLKELNLSSADNLELKRLEKGGKHGFKIRDSLEAAVLRALALTGPTAVSASPLAKSRDILSVTEPPVSSASPLFASQDRDGIEANKNPITSTSTEAAADPTTVISLQHQPHIAESKTKNRLQMLSQRVKFKSWARRRRGAGEGGTTEAALVSPIDDE
jgi:hypothetical protein